MKKLSILAACLLIAGSASATSWIRTNLIGYTNALPKTAVLLSDQPLTVTTFEVCDARSGRTVYTGTAVEKDASVWAMKSAYRLPFSDFSQEGAYYIKVGDTRSENFRIGDDIYTGAGEVPLYYMRQQRCGDNPYTGELCHQHDGYIVEHPTRNGEYIDVRGGWHDATDQLQYLTTSANATFQMMFAYYKNPDQFEDKFDASGRKGANGVPDILDEARWGLEWMKRMNPDSAFMFNQIADDRDHAGIREPHTDKVDYGWGPGTGRPVYFISGEVQGLSKYKNRTTGVSSSAAKYASAFALGSVIFEKFDSEFAESMKKKAVDAMAYAEAIPGACQTACVVSPYFYEEDNWIDDMELAAVALHLMEPENEYWLQRANYWGDLEPITPWMETGKARHYQWYPFVNLGHYLIAAEGTEAQKAKFAGYMREGLQHILDRAGDDPFVHGVPYLWCSNNFTFGALTQLRLYNELTGDDTFLEMEAALLDWIFGCNPWGTSMICDYPKGVDTPTDPHAIYTVTRGENVYGGLVDGPVYKYINDGLQGVSAGDSDPFLPFQNGIAVYHDYFGDYSTNEPTMDGTASMTYYLSTLDKIDDQVKKNDKYAGAVYDEFGAIRRMNPDQKRVYLVFTGDVNFEGVPTVLKTLKKHGIKASWFLTGNCVRTNPKQVKTIMKAGHYIGPHSDKHLLYAEWDADRKSLVTPQEIREDLDANMAEFKAFGIDVEKIRAMIPPYEHYNKASNGVLVQYGFIPVNLTEGTYTNADYTTPDMKNYRSSDAILKDFWAKEKREGLNGAIILIHPGTESSRKDKLYDRLDQIITQLEEKGYDFGTFDEE